MVFLFANNGGSKPPPYGVEQKVTSYLQPPSEREGDRLRWKELTTKGDFFVQSIRPNDKRTIRESPLRFVCVVWMLFGTLSFSSVSEESGARRQTNRAPMIYPNGKWCSGLHLTREVARVSVTEGEPPKVVS